MSSSGSVGAAGERLVADYLQRQGYQVLARNYRSRFGEIDIIVCDAQYIVFVEVKTRKQSAMVQPLESITPLKQQKIIKTALLYLSGHETGLQPRFDVVELILKNGSFDQAQVRHMKHAFILEAGNGIF